VNFDIMLAAFLVDQTISDYEKLAEKYHFDQSIHKEDIYGKKGKPKLIDFAQQSKYAMLQAENLYSIVALLDETLQEMEMKDLFDTIEMPLTRVLYAMEKEGVYCDKAVLQKIADETEAKINALSLQIYEIAGMEFNINSPKQLASVLYDELGLKAGKKRSTAADVLEKLVHVHPIIPLLLEHRKYQKIYSTYAIGLAKHILADGKIHTLFNQIQTQTGRLSSSEPNLQNISVRNEEGKGIRKAFVASEGHVLLSADYSQIELRLLAHMSGDEQLIEAFRENQDIHRSTASKVFHVPFDEVTDLQRRNAKAVNFGIVYGISAYGLSQDLNIGTKEAQGFIDSYFETYPKIKEFLDNTVAQAKEKGYTRTLFGRIRPIPELSSGNFMTRQFGERVAMNAPIQGTAADIIKIAMIRVHDRLIREHFRSRLILQVHDELLIETAEEEKEKVIALLEEEMQKAADLKVELAVGTACGQDWYEAH